MKDRVPRYPGRVKMTPVAGQANTFDMARADDPTQEGTPLNKTTLLKDATAALFGLGANAVPDDVFAFLGKYAQYWWRRRTVQAVLGEAATVMAYSSSDTYSGTAYYSDSYIINGNGEIELVNPSTVTIGYVYYTEYNTLKGKYFYTTGTGQMLKKGRIWFMPSDAPNATRGNDGPNRYYVNITAAELTLLNGDVEYITAPSQDAYPSGYADGYLYEYLGIPFENAVNGVRIETGSYAGTGTYGVNNPNSLTFDFVPKLVLIKASKQVTTFIRPTTGGNTWSDNCEGGYYTATWSDKTLSWYVDRTTRWFGTGVSAESPKASGQLNESGTTYYYVAIS